jgi:hypothetical protein
MTTPDEDFWLDLVADPHIAPHMKNSKMTILELVALPSVRAFPGLHGAYLAVDMLPTQGRFWDIHAAFKRAGWGREALEVGRSMINALFSDGAVAITNLQKEGKWRQGAPRSFGFRPLCGFEPVKGYGFNGISSILTREMWMQSPAYRRIGK